MHSYLCIYGLRYLGSIVYSAMSLLHTGNPQRSYFCLHNREFAGEIDAIRVRQKRLNVACSAGGLCELFFAAATLRNISLSPATMVGRRRRLNCPFLAFVVFARIRTVGVSATRGGECFPAHGDDICGSAVARGLCMHEPRP